MTSFYAVSLEFIADKQDTICAFLTTTRPIFNSSIIPVSMNLKLSKSAGKKNEEQSLLEVFLLSDTLQFSPEIELQASHSDEFLSRMFHHLVKNQRYFCRTLKRLSLKQAKNVSDQTVRLLWEISSLEKLELMSGTYLNLTNSSFIDSSSSSAPKWSNLREFLLSSCQKVDKQLVDQFILNNKLPLLRSLSVVSCHNMLTGPSLEKICSSEIMIRNLQHLNISFNGIDSIEALAKLTHLQSLNVSCLRGVKNLEPLLEIEALKVLNVSGCDVSDDTLKVISQISSLEELNVSYCDKFSSEVFAEVVTTALPHLHSLDCHFCNNITESSFKTIFSKKTNFKSLNVASCINFGKLAIKELSKQTTLEHLNLSNAPKLSSSDLYFLSPLQTLKTLTLIGWYYSESMSESARREQLSCIEGLKIITSESSYDLQW